MTPFSEIRELSLITIDDYKIDNLAQTDLEAFELYIQGFIIRAIPEFDGCLQSLEYELTPVPQFINTLTHKEKSILGKLVTLVWLERETNVSEFIALGLQGRDRKTHSEDANLKGKILYQDISREKIRQSINDYQNSVSIDEMLSWGKLS